MPKTKAFGEKNSGRNLFYFVFYWTIISAKQMNCRAELGMPRTLSLTGISTSGFKSSQSRGSVPIDRSCFFQNHKTVDQLTSWNRRDHIFNTLSQLMQLQSLTSVEPFSPVKPNTSITVSTSSEFYRLMYIYILY